MLSFSVGFTGAFHSPYLCWLTVPVTMLAARYRRTVVVVAIATAAVMGAAACLIAALVAQPPALPPAVYGVTVFALACALGSVALNLQFAEIESRRVARTDPLTGLLNRKAFEADFDSVATEAASAGTALSLLMLDLDHFKAVNDTYGHVEQAYRLWREGRARRGCRSAGRIDA